jgi:hypothetical protein
MPKSSYGIRNCETCCNHPEHPLFDFNWKCPKNCLDYNKKRKRELRKHKDGVKNLLKQDIKNVKCQVQKHRL